MQISISISSNPASELPGYRVLLEDEVPVVFFKVTTRLTREDIRAFHKGHASVEVLGQYDKVESEATTLLKNAGFAVKHVNYGIFTSKDHKFYKVEPGIAGSVRLIPVTEKCWLSNGRFK